MTDIALLARRRAEAAARLEALSAIGPDGDPEENREMAIATTQATAAYEAAEAEFQKATSTLTVDELTKLGITA